MIKYFILIFFFFYGLGLIGQTHWLINADEVPNCMFIREGKFVNKELDDKITEGYYMIFRDNYLTEYINNGEYFIKSKLTFISDCEYVTEVIEVSIPNYDIDIGAKVNTRIVKTALIDNLIEVQSEFEGKKSNYVFEKIKN